MAGSQSLFNTDTTESKEEKEEQKSCTPVIPHSASSTSSQSIYSLHNKHNEFRHDPDAKHEAMQVYLSDPAEIILDYLDGAVLLNRQGDEEKETRKINCLTLFGRKAEDFISQEASELARLILRGEEKEVEEALALVQQNPDLLRYFAKMKDPRGRWVQRTPLQIAAMAGDVDLREGIREEKNRGLVERLKLAGRLPDEEVKEQLEAVLTSKEAIEANEKRNNRVLDVIKAFGEGIIQKANEYKGNNFAEFQTLCQPVIDQLEKELTPNPNEVITLGYIFDPKILQLTAEWFEKNVHRFGGWWSIQSDVFWVNGFGLLQSNLSSRDAQVILAGIGNLVDYKIIPPRSLNNRDGTSYFYNPSSRLGQNFYLGYWGTRARWHRGRL